MKTYKLNHVEYANLIRHLTVLSDEQSHESVLMLLLELLKVPYDYKNCYFEVREKLMQCIAIANLCNMALIQYNDSHGEIDYACLGDNSKSVLLSIFINHI